MRNLGKIIVALLAGLLLFIGLTGSPKSGGGRSGQPQGPAVGLAPAPAVPADDSLTTAEYVGLGAPPPDRPWSGDDMATMETVLAKVVQQGPRRLPRFQSARSGAVFARMTSPGDLAAFTDRSVPLETRAPQALKYTKATQEIGKLYVNAFLKRETGDSEMLEIQAAWVRSAALLSGFVDEIEPTLKKPRPESAMRLQGLAEVKRGNTLVVQSAIMSLTETHAYRASERIRFIGHLRETLPVILPKLEPGPRDDAVRRLDALRGNPAYNDLQPALGQLHASVKAAVEAAAGR